MSIHIYILPVGMIKKYLLSCRVYTHIQKFKDPLSFNTYKKYVMVFIAREYVLLIYLFENVEKKL